MKETSVTLSTYCNLCCEVIDHTDCSPDKLEFVVDEDWLRGQLGDDYEEALETWTMEDWGRIYEIAKEENKLLSESKPCQTIEYLETLL